MRTTSTASARLAGITYIGASAGFLVVFSWLAAHFGYPDVLDHPAQEVLPNLLTLGNDGRAVWAIYAVLPMLLVPAVIGGANALRVDDRDRSAATLAIALQVLSSLAMTIGLARWSTLQWELAEAFTTASPDMQRTFAATSDALNSFLGNAIGEFVGELALYGSFAALALLLHRRGAHLMTGLAAVTALAGWVGMFRNMTPAVDAFAAASNLLLPAFLIAFGVWLAVGRRGVRAA